MGCFPTVLKWRNTSTHFTPFVPIMIFLLGGDTVQKCTMAVWIFHLMRHIWIANHTLTFCCLLCWKWDQWEHLLISLLYTIKFTSKNICHEHILHTPPAKWRRKQCSTATHLSPIHWLCIGNSTIIYIIYNP